MERSVPERPLVESCSSWLHGVAKYLPEKGFGVNAQYTFLAQRPQASYSARPWSASHWVTLLLAAVIDGQGDPNGLDERNWERGSVRALKGHKENSGISGATAAPWL